MNPVFTIGHSTRTLDELVALLRENGISYLIDVRRFPGSRRHPQFNQGNLQKSLPEKGIAYRHMEILGGRRGKPDPDSPNGGWRNDGFQAYADHIATGEAQTAVRKILSDAERTRIAVMCAEGVYWRCHRQILSDFLVAQGADVRHIQGSENIESHELRAMAKVREDGLVVYPPEGEQGELFSN